MPLLVAIMTLIRYDAFIMENEPRSDITGLSDQELGTRISELRARIFGTSDNPMQGMREMELGSDPESNATENEFADQLVAKEQEDLPRMREQLDELLAEEQRRQNKAA